MSGTWLMKVGIRYWVEPGLVTEGENGISIGNRGGGGADSLER